ncbi:response regulator [Candidatus Uabimicrobium amorphum]|uniref:DNA-binding response regulator n=1 Tax=Uabimicrobium amorphum TaxID=2596890 RepID=A0A5S9IQ81_UABAM|nr:response regulator transcription factor [Candidatus Uabimicrobium amorphum]BBM85884.1 DNA-binding response regulator [Candidatus Uabimicrobium amorphum]
MTTGNTRVFIVDDHPILIKGVKFLIENEKDFVVCGAAQSVQDALQQIDLVSPHVMLIDISLGGECGLRLTENLSQRHPYLPILIFSMHEEALYAERAILAGANGYINKNSDPKELISAMRKVLSGKIYINDRVNTYLINKLRRKNFKDENPLSLLNNRELEVFHLIGKGLTSRAIAKQLNISLSTIHSHKTNIKSKLNLNNSNELTCYAAQNSLS